MGRLDDGTDEELIRQTLAGHESAFEALLGRYTVRLLLFIRRIGGGALRADADEEDLFQAVSERSRREL